MEKNPELCLEILGLLHGHALDYRMHNPNSVNPINFKDLVVSNGAVGEAGGGGGGAVIMEPVGWFLHCVQSVMAKAEKFVANNADDDDVEAHQDLDKMKELLDMLAEKYSNAEIEDMDIEKNASYNRYHPLTEAYSMSIFNDEFFAAKTV